MGQVIPFKLKPATAAARTAGYMARPLRTLRKALEDWQRNALPHEREQRNRLARKLAYDFGLTPESARR